MNELNEKLWTKDFIVVAIVNFFISLIFFLLLVTIPLFAVDVLHATKSEAGLVTGIFIIGILFGRLFIGYIMNLFGLRMTLFIGLLFFTFTSLLYFISDNLTFLLINRFLHGLTMGIAATGTGTIAALIIPSSKKGEGIGYFSMSNILGTAIGPFIGLYLLQHSGFEIIFGFCLALGAISLFIAFFLHVPEIKNSTTETKKSAFRISNLIEPKALPIAIITLTLAFCYSSVMSFINFYAIELDLMDAASFFFLVYAIAVLISRPFTGRIMDLKGANLIIYPAIIIYAIGMLVLSIADNSIGFLLAGVLFGFGWGNLQSCTQAAAIKATPPDRLGIATATYFIFLEIGFGFGPYVIGLIIPFTGYNTLYLIMCIIILFTTVLYYFLHGKQQSKINRDIGTGLVSQK